MELNRGTELATVRLNVLCVTGLCEANVRNFVNDTERFSREHSAAAFFIAPG